MNKVWIKYNLHKDGTPIWDHIEKDKADEYMEALRKQGYKPRIDHQMSRP